MFVARAADAERFDQDGEKFGRPAPAAFLEKYGHEYGEKEVRTAVENVKNGRAAAAEE